MSFKTILNKITIIAIAIIAFSAQSCTTTNVGALEYHRSQLGINYNNHNIIYTFSPDSLFKENASTQLDNFDQVYFDNLLHQLTARNYIVGSNGQLQTVNLEQCIVSIEQKNQIVSALIACKAPYLKDSIFYAYSDIQIIGQNLDENTNKKLAAQLAIATAKNIDSIQIIELIKKDPIKYNSTFKKREINGLGQALIILLVSFILILA